MTNPSLQKKFLLFLLINLMLQKNPAAMAEFANWSDGENPLELFNRLAKGEEIARKNQPDAQAQKRPPEMAGIVRPTAPEKSELSGEAKKKLESAWLDMFFGIAWRQWMQPGTSLARAWIGAYDIMNRKLSSDLGKEHPNNPGLRHLKEYADKRKMETIAFIQKNEHTKNPMNVPQNETGAYAAIGDRSYNKGCAELTANLKSLQPKETVGKNLGGMGSKNFGNMSDKNRLVKIPEMTPEMLHLLRRKYEKVA